MSSLNGTRRVTRSSLGGETLDDATSRRARALGDISNKAGENDDSTSTKRKTRTTSTASKTIVMADQSAAQTKPRRISARIQAIKDVSNDNKNPSGKIYSDETEADMKQSAKRSSSRLKKEVTSLSQSNSTKQQTKRRRSSDKSPLSSSKKRKTAHTKATMLQASKEADARLSHIKKIDREEDYVVHPDFRLQRYSFKEKKFTYGVAQHDREFESDTLKVIPYVTDMFQHLYKSEGISRPRCYMSRQEDINAKMRAILIDWLVEVHMKFRLVPETLYLCVNIIDRYCSLVNVARSKLQLVGVTALLIACKYEEIYPPEVRDCVYITDRAYQCSEVLDMEQDIVHQLEFKITVPTAYPFLQRFLSIIKAPTLVKHAAHYYTERTLQEHDMLQYRPSMICASAIVLAINHEEIAEEESMPWDPKTICVPPILLEYTGFNRVDLILCAEHIAEKVAVEPVTASNRHLIAVKKKYNTAKFLNISGDYSLPTLSGMH